MDRGEKRKGGEIVAISPPFLFGCLWCGSAGVVRGGFQKRLGVVVGSDQAVKGFRLVNWVLTFAGELSLPGNEAIAGCGDDVRIAD